MKATFVLEVVYHFLIGFLANGAVSAVGFRTFSVHNLGQLQITGNNVVVFKHVISQLKQKKLVVLVFGMDSGDTDTAIVEFECMANPPCTSFATKGLPLL